MDDLRKALKLFRSEVTAVTDVFFIWKNFHNIASSERAIYRGVNENARTWNAIIYSLQNSFLIVLGRLFDNDKRSVSVHTLLKACRDNIAQFSANSLRQRKITDNGGIEPEWLDDYMKSTRHPSTRFFECLIEEADAKKKIFETSYKPIRHKFIAHRDIAAADYASEFFGKTNIGEIEELLNFLYQVEMVVFEALENGDLRHIEDFHFNLERGAVHDLQALLTKLAIPERD